MTNGEGEHVKEKCETVPEMRDKDGAEQRAESEKEYTGQYHMCEDGALVARERQRGDV